MVDMAGIMMMEGVNSTPEDVESWRSSLEMDSWDNLRLSFEYRHHDTSKCPFLDQNKPGFVKRRNQNVVRLLQSSRKNRITKHRRNRCTNRNSAASGAAKMIPRKPHHAGVSDGPSRSAKRGKRPRTGVRANPDREAKMYAPRSRRGSTPLETSLSKNNKCP